MQRGTKKKRENQEGPAGRNHKEPSENKQEEPSKKNQKGPAEDGSSDLCEVKGRPVPPCPARPPGAAVCLTSGTAWWSLPWAEVPLSPERTAPSGSPASPSSCTGAATGSDITMENRCGGQPTLAPPTFYLLWIFSSTFSAQKVLTSKSTPQA